MKRETANCSSKFAFIILSLLQLLSMANQSEGFVQPLLPVSRGSDYQSIGGIVTSAVKRGSWELHAVSDDENPIGIQPANDNTRSTGQRILDLSVPALGALLIDPLLTIADTAFVGRFSTTPYELAGMGSAAALLTFSFYLFNFLCTATTPLVSEKRSSGNEAQALATGGQALSLAFILGGILSLGLIVLRQPLLSVMGTSISGPEANGYAIDFLTMRAIAAPAVFCISASTGILRGYLDTKVHINSQPPDPFSVTGTISSPRPSLL